MNLKILISYVIILGFVPFSIKAQKDLKLKPGFITGFSYGFNIPGGDLQNRFGSNFKIDLSPSYYFSNSNISLGIEASYIFGSNVNENTITNLISYDNHLITNNNNLASINFSERGTLLGGIISKIIPFNKYKRTGIKLEIGGYVFRHWIKFRTEGGDIPQLTDNYLKGYDRLTGGFAIKEFIGYQYLKQDNRISFYAGFEFIQGFTKNLREYNYNSATFDKKNRKDYLFGIKLGWILPLYLENNPEEIYY